MPLVALVTLLLAACQGASPGQASSTARPSAAPTLSAQEQAAWQACGATAMPPASAFAMPAATPPVQNLTNAGIKDADARAWAAGFIREGQLESWAQTALQPGVLQSGCLGDVAASQQLFGAEVAAVQKAQQAQARVTVQLPRVLDIKVVVVPTDVQARVQGLLEAKSDYALVVHGQGPSATRIIYTDGRQEPVGDDIPGNQAYYAFFGGEYRKPGQGIGPIWFQKSVFNCQRDFLRAVCGI